MNETKESLALSARFAIFLAINASQITIVLPDIFIVLAVGPSDATSG